MSELIDYALRKMPTNIQQAIEVEVDGSVERTPPVQAAREILQQVVNVLIEQSAHSQAEDDPTPRQLRITASVQYSDGRSMVHFRFEDDRDATSDADISALFHPERSQGEPVSGLGLPWAENAVLAMGGRLFAEASRPYDGLVLHLLLLRAKNVEM
jgi:hypothetical protein